MNQKTISSDTAATPIPSITKLVKWPAQWVTGRVVMQHFGFCERTLRKFVKDGMPKYPIGRKRMRFALEEVYNWLLQEGADRFAGIGLANTVRQSCPSNPASAPPRQFSIPVPVGLTVTGPPTLPASPLSFDQAVALLVAEFKALRKRRAAPAKNGIAPPRCKSGRKPKNPGATKLKARCRKGQHRWRISAHNRTCVDCHYVEPRCP